MFCLFRKACITGWIQHPLVSHLETWWLSLRPLALVAWAFSEWVLSLSWIGTEGPQDQLKDKAAVDLDRAGWALE